MADSIPRFVRLNELVRPAPQPCDAAALVASLLVDGGGAGAAAGGGGPAPPSVSPVAWLRAPALVFSLPPGTPVASTPGVLQGALAGVDAASLAAVDALDPQPGDAVLDLCAAPGAKLAAIAARMRRTGSLTAVDASAPRLGTLCTLAMRYRLVEAGGSQPGWRCRVFHGDATLWGARGVVGARAPDDKDDDAAPRAAPHPPRLVLDSLRENLFRKRLAQGRRGLPPPVVPRAPVLESLARRLREGEGAGSGGGAPIRQLPGLPSGDDNNGDDDGEGHCEAGGDAAAAPAPKRARVGSGGGDGSHQPPALSPDAAALSALLDEPPPRLYDRVLVDAQCTHDGSPRHVAKAAAKAAGGDSGGGEGDGADGGDDAGAASPSPAGPTGAALAALQRGLLAAGWRSLKPGGTLVYSTCSMEPAQDEDVVGWLLASEPAAALVPLPVHALPEGGEPESDGAGGSGSPPHGSAAATAAATDEPRPVPAALAERAGWTAAQWAAWHAASTRPPWIPGQLPGTAVFHPRCSGTSGLFLAVITKTAGAGAAVRGGAACERV